MNGADPVRMLLPIALLAFTTAVMPVLAAEDDERQPESDRFRIGLVARDDLDPGTLGSLRAGLSRSLGREIEIFLARDQAALIDATVVGRVDYGVYSALAYATVWRLCACMEPFAAPLGADRSAGRRAILIESAGAPHGGRMAVAASHEAYLSLYRRNAQNPQAEIVETATAEQAEVLFARGDIDALIGWEAVDGSGMPVGAGTVARLSRIGPGEGELIITWRSGVVPFGPHALLRTLPEGVRHAIARAFLDPSDDEAYLREILDPRRSGPLRPVAHDDYRNAIEIVKAVAGRGG